MSFFNAVNKNVILLYSSSCIYYSVNLLRVKLPGFDNKFDEIRQALKGFVEHFVEVFCGILTCVSITVGDLLQAPATSRIRSLIFSGNKTRQIIFLYSIIN